MPNSQTLGKAASASAALTNQRKSVFWAIEPICRISLCMIIRFAHVVLATWKIIKTSICCETRPSGPFAFSLIVFFLPELRCMSCISCAHCSHDPPCCVPVTCKINRMCFVAYVLRKVCGSRAGPTSTKGASIEDIQQHCNVCACFLKYILAVDDHTMMDSLMVHAMLELPVSPICCGEIT